MTDLPLEPGALDAYPVESTTGKRDLKAAVDMSTAISMKRIADALEKMLAWAEEAPGDDTVPAMPPVRKP